MILKLIISKGHYSTNKCSRSNGSYSLHVFWCCFIFVPSFMKISLTIVKLQSRADKIFIRNISKGHNFTKTVGGIIVLVLCTLSVASLFLYPVSRKYLWRFIKCRVDMISIGKLSKGHNSFKNVDGVMILFLCTSSDDDLYLYMYKVSLKYSQW